MRITTAGESHGKCVTAILEGLPSGLGIDLSRLDAELARRQSGYGRGGRQSIEHDRAEILSGVRGGVTLGSPVTLAVMNRDYENWREVMSPEECDFAARRVTRVRPGHADLAGMLKYGFDDARNVLERASARETAARVAAGTVCRLLLERLGIGITGYVRGIGQARDPSEYSFSEIARGRRPLLGMMDAATEERAVALIDGAREKGDTLGGVLELRVRGLRPGFGGYATYGEKLDARLAAALMSVQAIKGVEIGLGFAAAEKYGSEAHDEIFPGDGSFVRRTNRAGGIEGGMSNGGELVLRAAMKPIPTLMRGLRTVDTADGKAAVAAAERSDVCAVTACEVVLEAALASELSAVVLERLGGDTMAAVEERYGRLPQ